MLRSIALSILSASLLSASTPQVWFAPLDDYTRQFNIAAGVIPSSAQPTTQFMDLFAPGAQWPEAASGISVFKMYRQAFSSPFGELSDDQLQTIFAFLNQHNIALALEFGPLTPSPGGCGNGVEGFTGQTVETTIGRILSNGGTLQYLAMDEPFSFGSLYTGSGACNWTPAQVAANAVTSLNLLKSAFPGLVVGDIEPVFGTITNQAYGAWMDAFQTVFGSQLAFFHVDSDPDNATEIISMRAAASQRGIPFGIIYDGLNTDFSDAQWTGHALQFFTGFELSNGPPDDAIFQSWMNYPITYLPETTQYSFTWLLDQYLRPRPTLSLTPNGTQAAGRLLDPHGNGIASAAITVTAQPTSGNGTVFTYTLTGTVPPSVTTATVKICVNLCGNIAANDMSVYSYQYTDSERQTILDFSSGLAGWALLTQTGSVQLGSDNNGAYLHISATPAQAADIDAPFFTVVPGSAYTLAVTARISPVSVGSGYFAVIFNPAQEVSRDTLAFSTAALPLGTTLTASDGSYLLALSPQNAGGTFQVTASYPGSALFWPAQATMSGITSGGCTVNCAIVSDPCDIVSAFTVGIPDVQLILEEALGDAPAVHDLNQDGTVNLVDIQMVTNAVAGLGCSGSP